jgi:type IV secretion system protein VirD4
VSHSTSGKTPATQLSHTHQSTQYFVTNPTKYWVIAILTWAVGLALTLFVARILRGGRNVGQRKRRNFGAPEWSRVARRQDLETLAVNGPTPGRTIFGTSKGKLLATEDRYQPVRRSSKRPHPRQGDRGAMLIVGPARSGKSQIAISAILEHDWTPAVLSSVKTDLILSTIRRRLQLGDVAIFDPLRTADPADIEQLLTPVRKRAAERNEQLGTLSYVGWSPVTASVTLSGAQQMARRLVEAAPVGDDVNDRSYWQTQAERVCWPMLHAAALGGYAMSDVVRWVVLGDQPLSAAQTTVGEQRDNTLTEVGRILTAFTANTDPSIAHGARIAHETLQGIWALPNDTRGGIYSAAQTLLKPWEDPYAAENADLGSIDLAWLYAGSGRNTLYVVMPPNGQDSKRFSVIFGGLLGELTDQVFATVNRTGNPIPDLMFLLDEAGNSPCDWLPEVATTCASNGLTLMTLWQSLAQAEVAFAKRTETLFTNHLTKIVFGGTSDQTTLDTAARLAGQHEVLTHATTDTGTQVARRSLNASTTSAGLLAVDLVRQVPAGQAVCIHGSLPPIHLHTRRWWQDKNLKRRYEGTAAIPPPLALPQRLAQELFGRSTAHETEPVPVELSLDHNAEGQLVTQIYGQG